MVEPSLDHQFVVEFEGVLQRWENPQPVQLGARRIEGQFPEFRRLLPETFEHEVSLPRAEGVGATGSFAPAAPSTRSGASTSASGTPKMMW